jgi:hypothetical protein
MVTTLNGRNYILANMDGKVITDLIEKANLLGTLPALSEASNVNMSYFNP